MEYGQPGKLTKFQSPEVLLGFHYAGMTRGILDLVIEGASTYRPPPLPESPVTVAWLKAPALIASLVFLTACPHPELPARDLP